jgi:hypothetical protein
MAELHCAIADQLYPLSRVEVGSIACAFKL